MPKRSDDFPIRVRRTLAARCGLRCSRPGCGRPTSGPHTVGDKAVNVGVAAHITAASPLGPRYDVTLTAAERRSIDNGVWLCHTCGTLVDANDSRYTADELRTWRVAAEHRRNQELEGLRVDEEARRRNRYGVVTCNHAGGVIRLVWRGALDDLETIEPPRTVSEQEMIAIYCALCKHQSEPVQPRWQAARDPNAKDVWEVDEGLTQKRRLRSPRALDHETFLRVSPRSSGPCMRYCPRCGRTSDGNYCSSCGGVPLQSCP